MTNAQARRLGERRERLAPGGVPKHIRIYDNGGRTVDRYAIVFSGRYPGRPAGWTHVLTCSPRPGHPQGVGIMDEVRGDVDRPSYGHLGKKIAWHDLPELVRRVVETDYRHFWQLGEEPLE